MKVKNEQMICKSDNLYTDNLQHTLLLIFTYIWVTCGGKY